MLKENVWNASLIMIFSLKLANVSSMTISIVKFHLKMGYANNVTYFIPTATFSKNAVLILVSMYLQFQTVALQSWINSDQIHL